MRGRMDEKLHHEPPFALGKPLEGGAVGEVVASNCDAYQPGDMVFSMLGWREAFTAPGEAIMMKLDTSQLPPEAYLGIAGVPGFAAYIGITQIAKLQAGDVIFISSAAGATGATACQIAKAIGATLIGSAGGAKKCEYLRELGVDCVIDYKATPDLTQALAAAAPNGIDVYFDNVGGEHLEAALEAAKWHASFVLCGMVTTYNGQTSGPRNLALAVDKRLRLEGFIVTDHLHLLPEFLQTMGAWIAEGKVTWRQTVEEGLERAPAALTKLFTGENFGKMLVKL